MAKKTSTRRAGNASKPIRILSIDGGGILGLTSVIYLRALERRLGGPLREHFDIVAGTSTGSILAVAVSAGIKLEKIEKLYIERGPEIFRGGVLDSLGRMFTQGVSRPKYGDDGLREALRAEMRVNGKPIRFGDLDPRKPSSKSPLTMVTAYETIKREAWIFKSHRDYLRDIEAWNIVKGSSSAPVFFPGHVFSMTVPTSSGSCEVVHRRFSLVDGGVFANNPAACALAEAFRERRGPEGLFKGRPSKYVVASFGNIENAADPISGDEAEEWGAIEWVNPNRGTPLISVMMDGSLETTQYICESLVPGGAFYRFELKVNDREDHRMDDASEKHLDELSALADGFVRLPDVQRRLDELAGKL